MSPFNPLFALLALVIALGTISVIPRRVAEAPTNGRYGSIDGLRGYLAFFVFLHHSAVWYSYLRGGTWAVPASGLFTQFGQGSVALFFMITGFLFFSKLLDARRKPLDWTRLYVSRILRLTPLYLAAMLVLAVVVARLSDFSLQEPLGRLFEHAAIWLTFTIVGNAPLNGVAETTVAIAGVTWSLGYEWFFYLSLPLLGLLLRVVPPIPYLLLSIGSLVGIVLLKPEAVRLLAFTGGFVAAMVIRMPTLTQHLRGAPAAFVAYGSLAAAVLAFPPAGLPSPVALSLLAVAFIIIASGNDLGGVLSTRPAHRLGAVSYSLYLLHGLLLFVAFKFVVGFGRAASLSALGHWAVVLCCTPLLVILCCVTYELIELPPIRWAPAVSDWLQARFRKPESPGGALLRRAS